jgi:tetratricopeptide (TPR) repeat protein
MKILFFFISFFLSLSARTQTEQQLIQQAESQEMALQEDKALETLKKVIKMSPRNYLALWKASELCSRVGNRQPTVKMKQELFLTGKSYAESAIKINPAGADGYYALSVAMGRLALSGSGKEKINAVKEIRSNAEKAIKINPQHGRAWHVIGKWHYEVSNLNIFEKAGVKLIYGGLPPASLQESIAAYEKARMYETNFALNYLELAKAYKRSGKEKKAIELLKILPSVPNKTADDTRIKKEGLRLLKDLTD